MSAVLLRRIGELARRNRATAKQAEWLRASRDEWRIRALERQNRAARESRRARDQRHRAELWKHRALERPRQNQCHYCGAPSVGSACYAHSDLLSLDDLAPRSAA